jgi:hypothetical protein
MYSNMYDMGEEQSLLTSLLAGLHRFSRRHGGW